LKSYRLANGKLFYCLTPKGGEEIDLPDAWHSSRYRFARSTVINQLILTDFALAMGIEYLPREKVLERFMEAKYSDLRRVFRSNDVFYEKDGVLYVLIIDNQLSLKYFSERIRAYSKLPGTRENIVIVILVFSDTKKSQVVKLAGGVKIKVLKASWKY